MKHFLKLNRLYVPMMVLALSIGFTSCSSENDEPIPPVNVTTDAMYGDYEGKMLTKMIQPTSLEEGADAPLGVDVSAQVDKDTIYFESFPIRDVVVAIVGEEAADKIIEAVGDINYKVGYEAELNEAKDSIGFMLHPQPLTLAISIPTEGEPQALNIEVKVVAETGGTYAIASTNQQFIFGVSEVAFVNGDERTLIENFSPITFDFTMEKVKGN